MSRAPPPYPGANAAAGPSVSSSTSSSRRSQASKSAGGAASAAGGAAQSPIAVPGSDTSHVYKPNAIDSILAEQGLERYHLEPPSWRAPWIVRPATTRSEQPVPSAATVGLGPNKSLIRLAGGPAPVAGPGGAASSPSLHGAVNGSNGAVGTGSGETSCTAWPVFYPPHDGMDEDRLTEQVVKQGFAAKSLVQAETFSAHQHIYEKLKTGDILGNLSRLVSAVRTKAESQLPTYGPSTFRLPSRITLTDSKREAWFSDLASPSVPLSKLSRSVPHGYKGEKGLDMLAYRKVEVDRAVWFVRAFGGVEIQSLAKTRPLATAIYLYTTDFTSVMCDFLRKQLAEVVLPAVAPAGAAPAPSSTSGGSTHASPLGPPLSSSAALTTARARSSSLSMQAKAAAASAAAAAAAAVAAANASALAAASENGTASLLDEDKRKAWEDKYEYTHKLAASLYRESLLDRLQFLRFLVSLLETSPAGSPGDTLGQLSFVVTLVEEYLDDLLESEPETARLAQGCTTRLKELENAPESSLRGRLRHTLEALVHKAFIRHPDSFACLLPTPIFTPSSSPVAEPEALERLVRGESVGGSAQSDELAMRERIYSDLAELRARRQLLSATLQDNPTGSAAPDPTAEDRARLAAIEHLDAFEFPHRVKDTHRSIFETSATSGSCSLSWATALPLLFNYAITTSRPCSGHRRYLVTQLIAIERDRRQSDAKRVTRSATLANGSIGEVRVEDAFIRWIDALEATPAVRHEVRLLAEELFRVGVMNYGAYLQRMIARGETERDLDNNGGESIHLWILRTVPLDPSLAGVKRRVAVSGKITAERTRRVEANLAVASNEVDQLFVRDPATPLATSSVSSLCESVQRLAEDGSQWTVTRDLLPNAVSGFIDQATGRLDIARERLAVICHIYKLVSDWAGLLQLLAAITQLRPSDGVLTHVVDVLHSRLDIWASLDVLPDLGTTLFAAFQHSKADSPAANRRLLQLLLDFSEHGLIDHEMQITLKQELQTLVSAASPASSSSRQAPPALPVPLPEMQALLADTSDEAVSKVASCLWHRYRGHPSWLSALYDSAVLYIPQTASIKPLVDLICQLDAKMPLGAFSDALTPWTASMRVAQAETLFGGPSGEATAAFFADLAIAGVFHPIALQKHLIAPTRRVMLRILLQATSGGDVGASVTSVLRNVQLVLTPIIANLSGKPTEDVVDLTRRQRIASRRSSMTRYAGLPSIAEALASLIIEQEAAARLGLEAHAQAAGAYFVRLASLPRLQALFSRAPKALRDGMLDNSNLNSLPGAKVLRPNLLAGLLVILKDGGAASPASLGSTEELDIFLSGLTIWRLNIAKVEVVACLERLELDPTISVPERYAALHTLSRHFLERVCTGDGKSYLGEQVVRCYSGTASDELVSVAFERLAWAVRELISSATGHEKQEQAELVLRTTSALLDKLLQSGTANGRAKSIDELLEAVRDLLVQQAQAWIGPSEDAAAARNALRPAHLLVLALRCAGRCGEKRTAELFRDCLALLAASAAAHARGGLRQMQLSTLLLDTCSAILYALPDLNSSVRAPTLPSLVNAPFPYGLSRNGLPDLVLDRLTRLFGPSVPTSLVRNPWELLDHADPNTTHSAIARKAAAASDTFLAPPTQLVNLGPIDLATFRARIIATIPAVTALDASSTVSTSSAHSNSSSNGVQRFEKGRQTNFDFETPCTTLSVSARDHRRTLNVTRVVSSRLEAAAAAGAQAAANAASMAAQAKAANATAAAAASAAKAAAAASGAGSSSQTVAPSGRGVKRRNSQQQQSTEVVVVIDSDDEVSVPAATATKNGGASGSSSSTSTQPKAKKAKTGSAGGASQPAAGTGRTASKTTAGKAPSKTTRKRKGGA
ncbi:hypothetical protein JCM10908_007286 [Rhodotorula pacifica]|uniref:mediator of RNA polymerase II transcription subunit 12 n=1 Tax=Rhodotorula pacifica TaxID=1495444 RepID=UPI00316D6609